MNEIYVVIDFNGYVESYRKFESARKDVRNALIDYAANFCYSIEELAEAMHKFDRDYEADRVVCSACFGNYIIRCVKSTIIED